MRVNGIVIPLIRSELCDLKTWMRHCPMSGETGKTVYLSIDQSWSKSDKEDISETYSRCHLHEEGWRLKFVECRMTADESFYLKSSNAPIDIEKYPYGQKSGPNMQFFRTIRALEHARVEIGAVLLMEVDAFPVVPDWLSSLNETLGAAQKSLMIAGPRYSGKSFLGENIKDHFNGNSVYFIGCGEFYQFLDCWEELLLESLKIIPWLAYDIVIPWYMSYRISNKKVSALTSETTEFASECYRNRSLDLTEVLINYGGAYENRIDFKLEESAFLQDFSSVLIVHGKCFIESIHALRFARKYPDRKHRANILTDVIISGEYEDSFLVGMNDYRLMRLITKKIGKLTSRQISLITREWTNE